MMTANVMPYYYEHGWYPDIHLADERKYPSSIYRTYLRRWLQDEARMVGRKCPWSSSTLSVFLIAQAVSTLLFIVGLSFKSRQ